MFDKLEDLLMRYNEIIQELNSPEVANDQKHFRQGGFETIISNFSSTFSNKSLSNKTASTLFLLTFSSATTNASFEISTPTLEIGYNQGEQVLKLLKEYGFFEIELIKDLAKLDRVCIGRWS
mgnify:CR=1 FL=1